MMEVMVKVGKQNKRFFENCGGMNNADLVLRLGLDLMSNSVRRFEYVLTQFDRPRPYTRAWSDMARSNLECSERFSHNVMECVDGKLCSVVRAGCS